MSNEQKFYTLQQIEKQKLLPNPPFPKSRLGIKQWLDKGRITITKPSIKIEGKCPRYYIALETINEWREKYNQPPL